MINITLACLIATTDYDLKLRDEPTPDYDDSKLSTLLLAKAGYDQLKGYFFHECKSKSLQIDAKKVQLALTPALPELPPGLARAETTPLKTFWPGRTPVVSFEYMDLNEGTRDGCMGVNDRSLHCTRMYTHAHLYAPRACTYGDVTP